MRRIRIGNGCGFWGDQLDAPIALAEQGRLDYLTLEYLAELTMSILALQRQRDPTLGYASDFLDVLDRLAPILKSQPGLKIVTNAGGMNPAGCAARAREILADRGLPEVPIGIVTGDDLMPRIDEHIASGHRLLHLDTGVPIESVRSRLVSANVYLGARPIAEALRWGAKIVITGRVADAALTLGPLAYSFGWGWGVADLDRLAAGVTAGHLIECGAQVTGGLWMNANDSIDFARIGYPIVDVAENGAFAVTKPEGSGGVVNVETVSEQLLYEVGDPAAYLTPDVTADFTAPTVIERDTNYVEVRECRGNNPTDTYKVSCAYRDGYMASGTLVITGPDAPQRAWRSGEIMLERLRHAGYHYDDSHIELLGTGVAAPNGFHPDGRVKEVVLKVAVRDSRRSAVERFTKEFAPLVTSGFAGTTGYTTGRPSVREVFAFWPALIAKSAVPSKVDVLGP